MPSIETQTQRARESVREMDAAEVSAELVGVLDGKLAAYALNLNGDSLTSAPSELAEPAMRELLELCVFLRDLDGDEMTRAWLVGMNPMLNEVAPISVIAEGRIDAAWTAARGYATLG